MKEISKVALFLLSKILGGTPIHRKEKTKAGIEAEAIEKGSVLDELKGKSFCLWLEMLFCRANLRSRVSILLVLLL